MNERCQTHTHPLQRNDVFLRQLVSGQRVRHVLPDQLLHTLLSDHGTAGGQREGMNE